MPLFRIVAILCAMLLPSVLGAARAGAATGTISGTVTSIDGPLAGACVTVFLPGAGEKGITQTDETGGYSIGGLAPGSYKVLFQGCDNLEYLSEWYDDAADESSAAQVGVQDGAETSGIDATLVVGGSISGRVTDESGAPLAGECVSVGNSTQGWGGNTNPDGTYRIPALPGGSYIAFFGCSPNHLWEYYDNKPNPWTADPILVIEGVETGGIDAALASAGRITGTVTDLAGNGILSVCVEAHGAFDYWQVATDENGGYYIDQLPPGDYRLFFKDCVQITHQPEWYDDKPDMASADPVTVIGDQTTTGIDAQLSPAAPSTGHIVGHVTDLNGEALAGICIEVRTPFGNTLGVWTTNEDGDFETGAFTPGGYKVQFRDCVPGGDTTPEWYDNKPTFAQANHVQVPSDGNGHADASLLTCGSGPDQDGDGITDCEESGQGSDPRDPDSDGDLFGDGFERDGGTCVVVPMAGGSDPMNALSNPLITVPPRPLRLPTPVDPLCR